MLNDFPRNATTRETRGVVLLQPALHRVGIVRTGGASAKNGCFTRCCSEMRSAAPIFTQRECFFAVFTFLCSVHVLLASRGVFFAYALNVRFVLLFAPFLAPSFLMN